MFDDNHDIPTSEDMGLAKFDCASFNAGTCPGAHLTSVKTMEVIEESAREAIAIGEETERDPILL